MSEAAGRCWEVFAVMKDGKLVTLVAKDPDRPEVTDITTEVAQLLHHKLSSPPASDDK